MRRLMMIGLVAGAAAITAPVSAAVVYSNDFNGENGGATALNYNRFNGLTVTRQSVDLTANGQYYPCAGTGGACVDLDGTMSSAGELETTNAYAFTANDLVTLSFDLSGSQRNDAPNPFEAGFRFDTATGLTSFTTGGGFGDSTVTGVAPLLQTVYQGTSRSGDPFSRYTLSFRAATAGNVKAYIGSRGTDNIGPVLDNFSLSVSAVPEPSTWAFMICGVGAVGGMMRRRARTTSLGDRKRLAA